jgi:hypothetical protein
MTTNTTPPTTQSSSKHNFGRQNCVLLVLCSIFSIWLSSQLVQSTGGSTLSSWDLTVIDFSSYNLSSYIKISRYQVSQSQQQQEEETDADDDDAEVGRQSSSSSSSVSAFDWFDVDLWESQTEGSRCYHIEDICHSSNEWFYNNPPHDPIPVSTNISTTHQPYPLSLEFNFNELHSWYPQTLDVQPNKPDETLMCRYSPIPNHFVLTAHFNDMLGEFFVRVFGGFWEAIQNYNTALKEKKKDGTHPVLEKNKYSNNYNVRKGKNHADYDVDVDDEDEDGYLNHFATQTQLYMHMHIGKKILDSLHLYLGTLSDQPVLPFTAMFERPGCTCFKRLFFCGYYVTEENTNSNNDVTPAEEATEEEDEEEDGTTTTTNNNDNEKNTKTTIKLEAGDSITRPHGKDFEESDFRQPMRDDVLNKLVRNNSIVREQVVERRMATIAQSTAVDRESQKDWTVIGLAQRNGRRRWAGLDDVITQCNNEFVSMKITCVIVNIEEEPNPMGHITAHAGLDALMGIHGAQLTHALLMPKGSLVVEFLAWLPYNFNGDEVYGSWTTWADRATPVGMMFTDTDLNHIGHPLQRSGSVDTCHGENYKGRCYHEYENHWGNRDFIVEYDVIRDIVQKFYVEKPKTCTDYENISEDEYVLYNIQCMAENTTEIEIRHFYRPNEWVREKANWTVEQEMNSIQ